MNTEKNDNRNLQFLHDECRKNMFFHVVLTMRDGSMLDGIIEEVEPDSIIALVGEDVMEAEAENESNQQRQVYGYGRRPRRRFRRFRRRRIPFGNLAALALLRYPYIAPPYPYYHHFHHHHHY